MCGAAQDADSHASLSVLIGTHHLRDTALVLGALQSVQAEHANAPMAQPMHSSSVSLPLPSCSRCMEPEVQMCMVQSLGLCLGSRVHGDLT